MNNIRNNVILFLCFSILSSGYCQAQEASHYLNEGIESSSLKKVVFSIEHGADINTPASGTDQLPLILAVNKLLHFLLVRERIRNIGWITAQVSLLPLTICTIGIKGGFASTANPDIFTHIVNGALAATAMVHLFFTASDMHEGHQHQLGWADYGLAAGFLGLVSGYSLYCSSYAIRAKQSFEIVKYLLDNPNIDVLKKSNDGKTALTMIHDFKQNHQSLSTHTKDRLKEIEILIFNKMLEIKTQ